MRYQKRVYRDHIETDQEASFEVTVKETNLLIHAPVHLKSMARDLVIECRGYLEAYIENHPEFVQTLEPWPLNGPAPEIVRNMIDAGRKAGTGPMAAVAGAVSQYVGRGLLEHTGKVVVENGGDIFLRTGGSVTIGIFAGSSPLSMKIGLKLVPDENPISVCTSSGTVGHSLSMGKADAVCVVSSNCSLADAVATSLGNRVNSRSDIQDVIDFGKTIDDVSGLVVIQGRHIGMWGEFEVVPLRGRV